MTQSAPSTWQFWIDRGGTFTDCLAISPAGKEFATKVLSSDRAPVEAIEAILESAAEKTTAHDLDCRVRLGTTVCTNALLERRGVPTALLTNCGLSGVFDIGTQERPELFRLEIDRPPRLQKWRLETPGRRDAQGQIVEALDLEATRETLRMARDEGARSLAIVWMHAHAFPEDELELARIAREVGFDFVACSHEQAREIGFLSRGETAIADAYLTPLLRGHMEELRMALPNAKLGFMQSSGGLTDAEGFRGPNALLSGPAGGVVGAQKVARDAGHSRVIGFDMGGTSTDVSLSSGHRLDRAFESEVGGVRVKAPMLRIHTVAAGGGSRCRFDGIRLTVGPESAGTDPGPLCYVESCAQGHANEPSEPDPSQTVGLDRRAGELTVTDINLALGRLAPDRFPFAIDLEPVLHALDEMVEVLAEAGFRRTHEEIAAGFFEIANASMAQAIIEISVERGADPRDHVLVGFGGAGGQHVCAIADRLGIREILLHPHAGLLSAYGIGIAKASWDGQRDGIGRELERGDSLLDSIAADWNELAEEGVHQLRAEGLEADRLRVENSLDLGYAGTDTALSVVLSDSQRGPSAGSETVEWLRAFEVLHRERFGYIRKDRKIDLKTLRVRVFEVDDEKPATGRREGASTDVPKSDPVILRNDSAWFPGRGRIATPVYRREDLCVGHRLVGPALVLEATGTVVLDPGFDLTVEAGGLFRLTANVIKNDASTVDLEQADPVRLEVLGNRFMSIAEQMGAVLRNTSVSTNIKERLDYSCAVFDGEGGLVANAPHIPVHLGAMADTISEIRARFSPFHEGDVLVTNDPFAGGSHLPDVTVVTPVFREGATHPDFFVASRGHHADLGGKTPGSMPADSTTLAEEGVLIEAFHLVRNDEFDEDRIRAVLASGLYPARRPNDNVADLEAMVAANRAGASGLLQLAEEVGLEVVHVTMRQLQAAAATKVARELARLPEGDHRFEDQLDDGTAICVRLSIEHYLPSDARVPVEAANLAARMKIDFAGTGPVSPGNLNAPPSVVRAAVIYVLRSLVAERIPLNGGCLKPVEVVIPRDSILDPPRGSAVVGGNVETSQRIVDVLLGALGRAAASQGTMNNVTFGDASFGYYETIGGGAGATPNADGASGVHTHMTNTRITDPEILESRYPVRLLEFGLRPESGGAGRRRGGDGVRRRYRFLRDVVVTLLTERRERAPFGLDGGEPGAMGRNRILRRGQSNAEVLAGRVEVSLESGDELWIDTPGGGGFGSPDETSKTI
ncbi:MAG: hydantoinase B/oxoprolinase family protein [Myxococcales bacterium]